MESLKEVKYLRNSREKHFLKSDGTMIAKVYPYDIHFFKDGRYEEIDNDLIKNDNYYKNKNNSFYVNFADIVKDSKLVNLERNGHNLSMDLKEKNNVCPIINKNNILYNNIVDDIDLKYEIISNKIKESIIIKNYNAAPSSFKFYIDTDLNMELLSDGTIVALNNDSTIFVIEKPYMIDFNGRKNHDIYYSLEKIDNQYKIELSLDIGWLKNAVYPVLVDPTISTTDINKNVYDTYIFQNDTNVNRNNQDLLKIGVEKINNTNVFNRALIKFELPTIGTGSQIISAEAALIGYGVALNPNVKRDNISIHRITSDWNEATANWNNMHNKFDTRVEDFGNIKMSLQILNEITDVETNYFNITNLVKKWYSGEPNHGFLMKSYEEKYDSDIPIAKCFSKNNNIQGFNPKPYLIINYRNQNGLEDHMEYQTQEFTGGAGYINLYNGNLTTKFNLGNTTNPKSPVNLEIIYNTNDVILNNNYGYGLGYKLNFHQEIKELKIGDFNLLEFIDEDGTLHYFYKGSDLSDQDKDPNIYYDEDGMNLTIVKEQNDYILKNGTGSFKFIKKGIKWFLSEIIDISGDMIKIEYDNNNRITKVIDSNLEEIIIQYNNTKTIVISKNDNSELLYDVNLVNLKNKNGETKIIYNNKNIIEKIIDPTLYSIRYNYYDTIPYRIKKISEYGSEGSLGNNFEFIYGFNLTTLKDEKNKYYSYTFNNNGNSIGMTNVNQNGEVDDSYGKLSRYGSNTSQPGRPEVVNKLLLNQPTIKTIKNYIQNSSFEDNITHPYSIGELAEEIITGESVTGSHSLKISTDYSHAGKTWNFSVPKGKYYTYSSYIKNKQPMTIKLFYTSILNTNVYELINVDVNNDFHREQITIYYPEDAISDLFIEINFMEAGTIFLDDMQLEEGQVANLYNILSNSDFEDGLDTWSITSRKTNDSEMKPIPSNSEIITLSTGKKALKLIGGLDKTETLEKEIFIAGKSGDVFDLYFWYKNNGVERQIGPIGRHALVTFHYTDGAPPIDTFPQIPFSTSNSQWQLHNEKFMAIHEYTSIKIIIFNVENANELYLTNFSLFKSLKSDSYKYDKNGNVKSISEIERQDFDYDENNELIKITDTKGRIFLYEYDNKITDRILRGISTTGISNETKYDIHGNPIITRISNPKPEKDILNKNYYIRKKGTNDYLEYDFIHNEFIFKNNPCSKDLWKFEKIETDYKISYAIDTKYSLFNHNEKIILNKNNSSLFTFVENKNGSYRIKLNNQQLYLTYKDQYFTLTDLDEKDNDQQFYLEDGTQKLFIENKATYTEDGKFISTVTDTLGRTTKYNFNFLTGLKESETNPSGETIYYTYNNEDQVIQIKDSEKISNYEYNNQKLLSKIIFGSKEYNFKYNEFFNIKNIGIGDQIFIDNEYDQFNGNLISTHYANGDNLFYTYDEFDRLKSVDKMDFSNYVYYYDNLNNLAKIESQYGDSYFYYNSLNNITEYKFKDFKINYNYGENSDIIKKQYKLWNNYHEVNYEYNEDGDILKISTPNQIIKNQYDTLGRLIENNLNDSHKVNYKYLTNGNKTSYLIEEMKSGSDKFNYIYDKNSNIIDIYLNNDLINHYEYNKYNELIKDEDYRRNKTIIFQYDMVGNVLSSKVYQQNTDILLENNTYQYNNANWEDQLTKYNEDNITYDIIGNPIEIGPDSLVWENGRQLKSYTKDGNIIEYEYNQDSIRIGKTASTEFIKYYLEGNNIVIEQRNSNVLYYLRDESDNLVGFKYNDIQYYYQKNAQNDIIGILNHGYQKIAEYQYDAWGKIISIKDANGDLIIDKNHIANINPFRYRSYYYDIETDLYYLNTRYYNPSWGRFLNADNILGDTDKLNYNLYSYCSNNPIIMGDEDGSFGLFLGSLIIGAVAGAFAGGIYGAARSKQKYNKVKFKEVIKYAVIGAIGGAIIGAAVGSLGQLVTVKATTGSISNVGKWGERASNIWGNSKKNIFTQTKYSKLCKNRIPDKFVANKYLMEVKNVRKLSLTRQIRDYQTIVDSQKIPIKYIIKTRTNTQLSKPLQEFIKKHKIIVKHLPW